MEFANVQNISVPAGIFESCQLNSLENESFDYWYSPIVKNSIKSVLNMTNDNSTVNLEMDLASYSLMDQQINITQHLMPPNVYAHEYVNITGEVSDMATGNGIPNSSVFLCLPYGNQVWEATTNNSGHYHSMIMAPLIHDDTPSNNDVGSDGIIAWISGNYGDGYRIATLTVEGVKYTFSLIEGWNLISIPTKNIWTAETLGQNISDCEVIVMFDGSTQSFFTHVIGTPWDNFAIEDGLGYFIYITNDSTYSLRELPISNVNVSIHPSWNLIGWYHDYVTTGESLGQNISGCSVVIMFDGVSKNFTTHVVGTPHDNFVIETGMGLFIYTTEASIWQGEG
jgi:hypothetical protein